MPTLANIAIAGAGLTTAGGIVGGGYFVFKNEPREISYFMQNVTKRELLKEGADAEEWKQAWQLYKEANTKTEMVDEVAIPPKAKDPAPAKGVTPKKVPKKIISPKDIWEINGWNHGEVEKMVDAPQWFKNKCKEKYEQEKPAGIWTTEYKNFEKFCTKPAPSDD